MAVFTNIVMYCDKDKKYTWSAGPVHMASVAYVTYRVLTDPTMFDFSPVLAKIASPIAEDDSASFSDA